MSEPIRPGDNPNELLVFDHGFVRLDDAMATDLSVVNSARVSFAVRKEEMDDRDKGLIKFLMRDRHGCYDDATDVLTGEGWKAWPEVRGDELFATRSGTGQLEYQPALAVVHKEHRGSMIGFKGMSLDMMVTPDHNVLACPTTTRPARLCPTFELRPAHSVLWRSHRHVTTAGWPGTRVTALKLGGHLLPAVPFMKLLGFFIGDGHLGAANGLQFHIRKDREVGYLNQIVAEGRLELRRWGESLVVPLRSSMRWLFDACYDAGREKQIPRFLLQLEPALLSAALDGLMHSDGCMLPRSATERWSYSTTSRVLADGVQELALKVGRSASIRPQPRKVGDGHYGSKQVWRLTIYERRNSRPGLCRTRAEADNHMGVEEYNGNIHCVTVPNGTLYVRRNGYPAWSGNSPFEHNSFRFHIRTPIFVAREWFRHRIGCLTGDSEVSLHDGVTVRVEDLWGAWRGGSRDQVESLPIRVLNERSRSFGEGRISQVFDKGVQPVYRMTLADSSHLTLTENHRVLTDAGWLTLNEGLGLAGSPLVDRSQLSTIEYLSGTGSWNVRANGAVATLERARVGPEPVAVTEIEYIGLRQTYDLCVEGPWHNFVANGIVVHNSFNEESARYHKLADDFYVPDVEAVRSQVGKPGSYSFEPVDEGVALEARATLERIYKDLYAEYNALIDKGVAKELARSVLPFGIYTQFYWTINARAMMNFLSLRNSEFAQYEIRVYAEAIERFFAERMPITHECFVEFERRAP
ncbi:MAG: FAD-dependent thymidylate synthase [Actinomycetota bacterium]